MQLMAKSRRLRASCMAVSVKADRILQRLGVLKALARGDTLVLVGRTYELLREAGSHVRLAFLCDDEGRLCVGYAREDAGEWSCVDSEPFSLRAFGYYERRLKRIGKVADPTPRRR